MDLVRCACGNILGQTVPTGQVAVRHHGRELVGFMTAIRCEKCGRVWPPGLAEALTAMDDGRKA